MRLRPATVATIPASTTPVYANVYKGNIGVTTHIRTQASPADMVTVASRLKGLGFDWIREDAVWQVLEPTTKGTYVWTSFDNVMIAASKAGLTVLPVIGTAPQWASGSADFYVPPTTNQDYADFAAAFCARYRAGGAFWTANPTLVPKPVTYIELWNEPFGNTFFHGSGSESSPWNVANGPSPAKYAGMCKAVGTTLRAASSPVKILICGEAYGNNPGFTTAGFFAAVLAAEPTLISSNLFDGYAVHPYVGPFYYGPWDLPQGAGSTQMLDPQGRFDKVVQAQRQLAAAGGTGKECWVTEFGWQGNDSAAFGINDDQWADWTVGGAKRLLREWGVTRCFIYTIDDLRASAGAVNASSLLKFSSAGQPGTPRKPLIAVQKLITGVDALRAYQHEVLADSPALYVRLGGAAPAVADLSPSLIQNIAASATGLTRGQTPLTSDPLAASTLFDGVAGTITVPNDARLNSTTQVTLEAWYKLSSVPAAPMALIRKMSQYHLILQSNGTLTVNANGTNQVTVTAGTVPFTAGYGITGVGVPGGTTVVSVSGSVMTLSNPVTTGTGVVLTPQLASVGNVIYQATAAQSNNSPVAEGLDIAKVWHIVGTYDGVNMNLFVNGRLIRQTAKTGAIDTSTNPVGIGWRGVSATDYFGGWGQEKALYTYALSPRRIAEHYEAGVAALAA